jgi:hypothetical protein
MREWFQIAIYLQIRDTFGQTIAMDFDFLRITRSALIEVRKYCAGT